MSENKNVNERDEAVDAEPEDPTFAGRMERRSLYAVQHDYWKKKH